VGASELKLRLDKSVDLFEKLFCIDFMANDGGFQGVALEPENLLSSDKICAFLGAATLSIEPLRWDQAIVRHDLAALPSEGIARWFRRWFDPDDERANLAAELLGVIHSLQIKPGVLFIDFGTAPTDAFWELLALLEDAGTRNIQVGSPCNDSDPLR
jgi:hypothetical protein